MDNKAFVTTLPDFVEIQRASFCWFLSKGLSEELENFSSINQSILVKKGTKLRTISVMKNILAEANIDENLVENTVVQVLDLDPAPIIGLDIQCSIFRVKDQRGAIVKDVLKGVYNDQNHQCELQINQGLIDKEKTDSLEVMVKLKTQSAFVNPARMISTVFLNIQDVNDNKPTFVFNERQNQNDDQNKIFWQEIRIGD